MVTATGTLYVPAIRSILTGTNYLTPKSPSPGGRGGLKAHVSKVIAPLPWERACPATAGGWGEVKKLEKGWGMGNIIRRGLMVRIILIFF
jgi:hypothetical protein